MYPKKDNTLSLLGGAVLGAVAMYLLDPEAGPRRRHELATKADDATSRAGETLGPIWDRVSDTARSFGGSLATGASAFGGSLAAGAGSLGHGIAERFDDARHSARGMAREAGGHLSERASDLSSSLADALHGAGRRARAAAHKPVEWFRPEPEPSHAGAYTAAGIGTLVLGAAAMYFLDPQRGRARRNQACDQAMSVVRRTGRMASQMGQNLRNRAMGYAHETRSGWFEPEDAVSAERLLQRIRSEMGHVVSHAGAIQVMTDNHGRVTLHGKVLASEADRLIATVKGVSGVNEVINLLSVKETEQQMHEADATGGGVSATTTL